MVLVYHGPLGHSLQLGLSCYYEPMSLERPPLPPPPPGSAEKSSSSEQSDQESKRAENFARAIDTEAHRRIEIIEAVKGMSPEDAAAYRKEKERQQLAAIEAKAQQISNVDQQVAFRRDMQTVRNSPDVLTRIEKIVTGDKESPPPPAPPSSAEQAAWLTQQREQHAAYTNARSNAEIARIMKEADEYERARRQLEENKGKDSTV
jgi:hypothetical protein